MTKSWGLVLMVLCAFFFASMAVIGKQAFHAIPAEQVAFVRFLVGILIVLIRALIGPRLRSRNWKILLFRGILSGSSVLLYFIAMKGLPIGIASLLNYSSPVFSFLWAVLFLKEHFSLRSLCALGVTMVGIVVITWGSLNSAQPVFTQTGGDHSTLFYIMIGIASAVVGGAGVATIRSARKSEGAWELFLSFCIIGAFITGVPSVFSWKHPTTTEWFYLGGVGITAAAGQLCMTYALKEVSTLLGGLIMLLIPVLTMIVGILFLGDRINLLGIFGGTLTLAGISYGMLLTTTPSPTKMSPPPPSIHSDSSPTDK